MSLQMIYYIALNVFLLSFIFMFILLFFRYVVNLVIRKKYLTTFKKKNKEKQKKIIYTHPSYVSKGLQNSNKNKFEDSSKIFDISNKEVKQFSENYIKNNINKSHETDKEKDESSINSIKVRKNTQIKQVVNSILNNETQSKKINNKENNNQQNELSHFWDYHSSFFYKQLNMHKILLLKINNKQSIQVERYINFSIDVLFNFEEEMNRKKHCLKKLLFQNRFLYFKGELSKSKLFGLLFNDFEQNQYNQIYLLPVCLAKKDTGVLLLFQKISQSCLPKNKLQAIMNDVLISNVA